MGPTPRPYQAEAIDIGIQFFLSPEKKNGIEILPTGSGKSVVIANIAAALDGQVLVFQPSSIILGQNLMKYLAYGYRAGVYSASTGSKFRDKVTFVTIGSVAKKAYLFRDVKYIIIDECHLVNSEGGMYESFLKSLPKAKVLGLTATPYRLSSSMEGSQLKFLTSTSPRIFTKVLYYIQNKVLFDAGHLAKLEYYAFDVVDRSKLTLNSSGSDFTEASLRSYYRLINMPRKTIVYANRLLKKRKNCLIFCSLIKEAEEVSAGIPGSVVLTGDTPKKMGERILAQFKRGTLQCLIVVGMLTTGFDFPELECILIARSTMSLAWYYQVIGRGMRPHPDKLTAWIVDLGGNIRFFGKVETMEIRVDPKGRYAVWNNGNQLTNVIFKKV